MPDRIITKLAHSDLLATPAAGYTTATATASAGWITYAHDISTIAGITATVFGIVLSSIVIRLQLARLKNEKQARIDSKALSDKESRNADLDRENKELDRQRLRLEVELLQTTLNETENG